MTEPTDRFALVKRTRDDMHNYQANRLVPFLKENPFSGAFVDMGLGKTVSTATVVADCLEEFLYDYVLIVAPLKVAAETWPTEFTAWEHLAPYDVSLIHCRDDDPRLRAPREAARIKAKADAMFWGESKAGTAKYVQHAMQKAETAAKMKIREAQARSRKSIHVISRDWIEWLANFWGPKWPYRAVIIDESSGFKDQNSGRFKALAKVRRTPGLIQRLHILTATPAAETYEHLFSQIYLLDLGERLGKNITSYRNSFFTYNQWSHKYKLRPGCEQQIIDKIADVCLVMKVDEYLPDLPKPTIVPRPVTLSAEVLEFYGRMQEDYVVTMPDGSEIEAETAAALSSKLLQIASGVLYETRVLEDWDTGDMAKVKRVHHIHDEKIDELRDIVEEAQGQPLLVAYHFKSSLARLQKAFPKAVTMDKDGKCVKRWNAGKIPMLLIHPQSAGHGLNLQQGGHHLIFFDLPWSLENFLQTVGRLARQGQTHPVIVYLLTARGTLDELVAACLEAKKDAQELMFRLLRKAIKKLRG